MPMTKEGMLAAMIAAAGEPKITLPENHPGYEDALEKAKKYQEDAFEPLAKAVVEYIKQNAVVSVTVVSAPPPAAGFSNSAGPALGSVTTTGTIS